MLLDALSGFLTAGDALSGKGLEKHRQIGMSFMRSIVAEQASRYESFAKSQEPTSEFPKPYILPESDALVIKDQALESLAQLTGAARYQPLLLHLDDMMARQQEMVALLNPGEHHDNHTSYECTSHSAPHTVHLRSVHLISVLTQCTSN